MDVKIHSGAFAATPAGQVKPAAPKSDGASFAESLRAAGTRRETAATPAPEAVFEQAFADRANPDFQLLDDYLAARIEQEMESGGL